MAPALRPTGRFYAAFYRWSCSAVRHPHCSRSIRRLPPCFTARRADHAYSTTRRLLNNNATASAPKASREESGSTSADQEATSPDQVQMKTAMRSIMRQVPSTVIVITAFAQDGDMRPLPLGSAISSLTTVTLDPPHVSFNVKTPSRTLDAIREAGGRFCVHFLDNSLLAAKVAHNFTEGNSLDTLRRRNVSFRFAYPTTNHERQPPKLVAHCVVASMTCQLEQEAAVADHVVAIASVKELDARSNPEPALFYHAGRFKRYDGGTLYHPASAARDQKEEEEEDELVKRRRGKKDKMAGKTREVEEEEQQQQEEEEEEEEARVPGG
ncbi:flavin reductase like domain-containing protein [Paraphaeosphaeria sporulosa]